MIAVPNKAGASGVINDMLAGATQVAFLNVVSAAPQVKAGSFRTLAVVSQTSHRAMAMLLGFFVHDWNKYCLIRPWPVLLLGELTGRDRRLRRVRAFLDFVISHSSLTAGGQK